MEKIEFKDLPNTTTPINATNLNKIQQNVEENIDEVDTNKLDKTSVVNEKIDSNEKVYSCNYINDYLTTNYADNQIVPTNEFLNNKRVYTKRLVSNEIIGPSNEFMIKIPHGITNFDDLWIDLSNSYLYQLKGTSNYVNIPIVSTAYLSNSSDETSATIQGNDVLVISTGGWNSAWTKVVTIKFTYTN